MWLDVLQMIDAEDAAIVVRAGLSMHSLGLCSRGGAGARFGLDEALWDVAHLVQHQTASIVVATCWSCLLLMLPGPGHKLILVVHFRRPNLAACS